MNKFIENIKFLNFPQIPFHKSEKSFTPKHPFSWGNRLLYKIGYIRRISNYRKYKYKFYPDLRCICFDGTYKNVYRKKVKNPLI